MQLPSINLSTVSGAASGLKLWGDDTGPSFDDVIDLINPLQHIPVISNIYQQETGDSMGAVAKVVGATVLGGPIGGVIALANEVVEAVTGTDVTGHLLGLAGMEQPSHGKTEVIIPKPEETEDAAASTDASPAQNAMVNTAYKDTIRTTTKEWIYGDLAAA